MYRLSLGVVREAVFCFVATFSFRGYCGAVRPGGRFHLTLYGAFMFRCGSYAHGLLRGADTSCFVWAGESYLVGRVGWQSHVVSFIVWTTFSMYDSDLVLRVPGMSLFAFYVVGIGGVGLVAVDYTGVMLGPCVQGLYEFCRRGVVYGAMSFMSVLGVFKSGTWVREGQYLTVSRCCSTLPANFAWEKNDHGGGTSSRAISSPNL